MEEDEPVPPDESITTPTANHQIQHLWGMDNTSLDTTVILAKHTPDHGYGGEGGKKRKRRRRYHRSFQNDTLLSSSDDDEDEVIKDGEKENVAAALLHEGIGDREEGEEKEEEEYAADLDTTAGTVLSRTINSDAKKTSLEYSKPKRRAELNPELFEEEKMEDNESNSDEDLPKFF